MELNASQFAKRDRDHLIHPLHNPVDPIIYVRGRGTTVEDISGQSYLDGLSGLWNVNVGHGRAELAQRSEQPRLAGLRGLCGLRHGRR